MRPPRSWPASHHTRVPVKADASKCGLRILTALDTHSVNAAGTLNACDRLIDQNLTAIVWIAERKFTQNTRQVLFVVGVSHVARGNLA